MNDILLVPAVADAHAAYHRERLVSAQRGYAGKMATERGRLEARVDAARRVYQDRPTHPNEIDLVLAERDLRRFDGA